MCPRSLKDKVKALSLSLKQAWDFLNTPIDIKKTIQWLLADTTYIQERVKINKLHNIVPDTYEYDFSALNHVKINPLRKQIICARNCQMVPELQIHNDADSVTITTGKIKKIDNLKNQLRWKRKDLSFLFLNKKYPIDILSSFKTTEITNLAIDSADVCSWPKDEISLARRLRLNEEIVQIYPYTKALDDKVVLNLPVEKEPIGKSYFSSDQMDNFKEILASQGKTRPSNIEILAIFDKFNIEMYSNIAQNAQGTKLICTLKQNAPKVKKERLYYLLIARRRDNKTVIKALAQL